MSKPRFIEELEKVPKLANNLNTTEKGCSLDASQAPIIVQRIEAVDEKITGINVTENVRAVIDERVNTDKTSPLNTIITSVQSVLSNAINTAKNSVVESITTLVNGLPQKSVWTDARAVKLDNVNQSISTTQTNITNSVNAARDNNNAHVTTEVNRIASSVGEKYYKASDNFRETLSTTKMGGAMSGVFKVATWTAKYNGTVNVHATISNAHTDTRSSLQVFGALGDKASFRMIDATVTNNTYEGTNTRYSTLVNMANGTNFAGPLSNNFKGEHLLSDSFLKVVEYRDYYSPIKVKEGDTIVFSFRCTSGSLEFAGYISQLRLGYDEVTL